MKATLEAPSPPPQAYVPADVWALVAAAADSGAAAWQTTRICRASMTARSSCDVPAQVLMSKYGASSALAVALQYVRKRRLRNDASKDAIIRTLIRQHGAHVNPKQWTIVLFMGLNSTCSNSQCTSSTTKPCVEHKQTSGLPPITMHPWTSHTPLSYAISHLSDLDIVDVLLEGGADVNARAAQGLTPLMIACMNSHPAIVARLLAVEGIDVDARAPEDTCYAGRTALSMATESSIVFLLFAAGAHVDARDSAQWTPLMHAVGVPCSTPPIALIYALLECGADPSARALNNRTVMMMRPDSIDVDAALMHYRAASDDVDGNGMTALMHAAHVYHCLGPRSPPANRQDFALWSRDDATVAWALVHGARDPSKYVNTAHTITGKTALMSAPSAAFARVLINEGAAVDQEDACGITALMYASFYPHTSHVVRELMAAGANVNKRDQRGHTALMYAASNPSGARALLEDPRTDVNACDECGVTALMMAVAENQYDVVDLILTMRASTSSSAEYYEALDLSAQSMSPDSTTVLTLAARCGHLGILNRLLHEHHTRINSLHRQK